MMKAIFISLIIFISGTFQSGVNIPHLSGIDIEVPHEHFVYFLDDSNFYSVVDSQPIIVVKFFTSSYDYLNKKKFDFYTSAEIAARKINVPFAVVELDTSPKLSKKMEHDTRNPSVKVFVNGNELEFYGPYGPEDMVSAIEKYKNIDFSQASKDVAVTEEYAIELMRSHKISAILIYERCPRSDFLRKEYLKALPVLRHVYNFPVFLFDGEKSSKLRKMYSVTKIPEVLICYGTKCYKHEGHHLNILDIVPKLISFLNNEHKIDKLEELFEHQKHDESQLAPHFLAIIDKEDSEEFRVIEHMFVAYQINTPIYYSTNKDIMPVIGCAGAKQCLRIHFPTDVGLYEDEEIILKELLRDEQLLNETMVADYIVNHTFPLVSYKYLYDHLQFKRYMRQLPRLIYFGEFGYNNSDFDFSESHIERGFLARRFLVPLAKKHRDIKFAVSSNRNIRNEAFLNHQFHLNEAILITDEYNLNYFMNEDKEITLENIDQFIGDFKAGNLEPIVLSLEEPRISHFYDFRIAVGKTLKKYASNHDKDTVLVLIKDIHIFKILFKHELEILTHIVEANPLLNPVIMDINGNDVPTAFDKLSDLNVFLLPSGNIKRSLKYEGSFTAFKILEFLKTNGEISLKGWVEGVNDEL